MNFTKEQLEKAKEAKSAEELLALAKENNIEMTAEEAAKNYAELHKSGELSDDELNNVSGGGCGDDEPEVPPHTIAVGTKIGHVDRVGDPCPVCGVPLKSSGGLFCPADPKFKLTFVHGGLGYASYYYVSSNDNS